MARSTKLPLPVRQALNEAVVFTKNTPRKARRAATADILAAVRVKLGLSQAEVADRLGMTQPQIARLESGRVDARLGTWRRVFDALHCDLVVLPKPRRWLGDAKAERVLG